jgi:hypothetical protein
MDMTAFAPREFHPVLNWLGKREWVKFIIDNDFRTKVSINLDKPSAPKEYINKLNIMFKMGPTAVSQFWAMSRTLAFGPKVFLPSYEQCCAMRKTQANIPLSMYRQPYDQMIISFPREYIRDLSKEFNLRFDHVPRHMLQCYEQKTLIMCCKLKEADYVFLMSDRPEFKTIEDALDRNDGVEHRYVESECPIISVLQRLAVNFGSLMTYTGTTAPIPTPNKIKLSRRSDERSQLLAMGEPSYFTLAQKINIHRVKRTSESEGTGEGVSPKPHWRWGHWRNQPCGVGNQDRKLIFIEPVFVCSHLFNGDLGDTSVEYK